MRTASAHEEGGQRLYEISSSEILGVDGHARHLRIHQVQAVTDDEGRTSMEPVPGSDRDLPADLILLAMGFTGPERGGVIGELGLALDARGNVEADDQWQTSHPGVFVCGDMTRGQSLIVWAIAEGRSAAAAVDAYLMGESDLPSPIVPGQLALR
jgi:glutamate synthase (NADPH/NADH) small chain